MAAPGSTLWHFFYVEVNGEFKDICSTLVPCISLQFHFRPANLLGKSSLRTFSLSLSSPLLLASQVGESLQPGSSTSTACFHRRLAVDPVVHLGVALADQAALAGVALAGQVDRHHCPVLLQVVLEVAPESDSSNADPESARVIHQMQETLDSRFRVINQMQILEIARGLDF